mmetsp:Transcript_7044/g.8763  ORF Transcript_7044/g.8763 Transcript_7044/m.8763 type:complete len:99 (+) Transcript_7044:256-552(+)
MLGHAFTIGNSEEFAGNLFEIMHGCCPSAFNSNCYSTEAIDNFVNGIICLLVANENGNGKLIGKSFGCRVLSEIELTLYYDSERGNDKDRGWEKKKFL